TCPGSLLHVTRTVWHLQSRQIHTYEHFSARGGHHQSSEPGEDACRRQPFGKSSGTPIGGEQKNRGSATRQRRVAASFGAIDETPGRRAAPYGALVTRNSCTKPCCSENGSGRR